MYSLLAAVVSGTLPIPAASSRRACYFSLALFDHNPHLFLFIVELFACHCGTSLAGSWVDVCSLRLRQEIEIALFNDWYALPPVRSHHIILAFLPLINVIEVFLNYHIEPLLDVIFAESRLRCRLRHSLQFLEDCLHWELNVRLSRIRLPLLMSAAAF